MLNDRRRRILTALVREYIRSAHPVGSKSLVDHYALECSPATVRNDLAALEDGGFVSQPHVSAGRVPTDSGYREFVDELREGMTAGDVVGEDIRGVRERLRQVESELTDLMRETASLLTRLTNYAAVVLAPTLRRSRVRRVDLVPLSEGRVLIVLITDTGQVAKRFAELGAGLEQSEVAEIEAALNAALAGRPAEEVLDAAEDLARSRPRPEVWMTLIDELLALLTEADETSVYHGGAAALLEEPEFEDPEMVRSVVGLLEDGLLLARTFDEVDRARGVLVRIGAENPLEQLGHLSMVLAPYGPGGSEGYVGLLGPTRMDYLRAITSVRCVAETLGETLGETLAAKGE